MAFPPRSVCCVCFLSSGCLLFGFYYWIFFCVGFSNENMLYQTSTHLGDVVQDVGELAEHNRGKQPHHDVRGLSPHTHVRGQRRTTEVACTVRKTAEKGCIYYISESRLINDSVPGAGGVRAYQMSRWNHSMYIFVPAEG